MVFDCIQYAGEEVKEIMRRLIKTELKDKFKIKAKPAASLVALMGLALIFMLAPLAVALLDAFTANPLSDIYMPVSESAQMSASEVDGYRKLLPDEALEMINTYSTILDVRTQEEYDEGHLEYAILLPDYEIKDRAEEILPYKNPKIYVYCQTGVRSANAAKELAEMGYTDVYDIGGIEDWKGKIIKDGHYYNVYYNYFGGDLPKDIEIPIDYTIRKKIHRDLPKFTFNIRGINVREYKFDYNDKSKYYIDSGVNRIYSIVVSSEDGTYNQKLTDLRTETPDYAETYGFSLDDWNFDGYLDISLWRYPGGTMRNSPTYYWLWDDEKKQYIENEELEGLSDSSTLKIDSDKKQISGFTRGSSSDFFTAYYKYQKEEYICVESEHRRYEKVDGEEDKYEWHITVKKLINGEMKVTKDYYEDIKE